MSGRIEIFRNAGALAAGVADWLMSQSQQSYGDFRLVLSGGSTPRALYELLGARPRRDDFPWPRLQLFWGDERFVPHNDPASNFGMALTAFLLDVPIRRDHVYAIPTDGTPADAAARYEATLRQIRAADGDNPTRPMFDVVLLGLGADGHTASLFPDSAALDEQEHWVVPVENQPMPRITLTYPAIANSRHVAFLVTGQEKQKAAMGAIARDRALPAGRVTSEGEVVWFLDRAAGEPLYHK
jgi:6-phosphogluconolactonase